MGAGSTGSMIAIASRCFQKARFSYGAPPDPIVLAHTLGNPFHVEAIQNLSPWKTSTGSSRTTAMRWDHGSRAVSPAPSATSVRSASTQRSTVLHGRGRRRLDDRGSLQRPLRSLFRDWGRDCWCAPGADNTCGKRFHGRWAIGRAATTTDSRTPTSAISSRSPNCTPRLVSRTSKSSRISLAARESNSRSLRDGLGDLEEYLVLPLHAAQRSKLVRFRDHSPP